MAAEDADTFGDQLRRLRLARGLTQEALAEKAGLSPRAIGALEQGERRGAHRDTVRLLAEALGLGSEEHERLEMAAASQRKRQPRQRMLPLSPRHNLPAPLSSFIGREREVGEVRRLLGQTRLLTLTGTGGAGKTRLAMEVARGLATEYRDGVWLVELAAIADAELVPSAVAAAVGVRELPGEPLLDTLGAFLSSKQLLLFLDNCEHLIDAVADLTRELLVRCPELRVLATSREALRIAGETRWTVPAMSVPGPAPSYPVASLSRYEAVSLFTARATARQPAFRIDSGNASAVVEACRKMDGLPLAVELAAARVDVLTAHQIAERLGDFSHLLTGGERGGSPRQRTLDATLEWSHDLLTEPERRLFAQLSVFAGGWSLESAEDVTSPGAAQEVLELLSRLVEQSLVTTTEVSGEIRYGLLEPVRQYAKGKLESSGQAEQLRRCHAEHFLRLAETAEPGMAGPNRVRWLDRLEREHDNLRAALTTFLEGVDAELGLRLCGPLGQFWSVRGHWREGRAWLEQVLTTTEEASPANRANALMWLAHLEIEQGEYERAGRSARQSLALFDGLGDKQGMSMALGHLGRHAAERGEVREAQELQEEALVLARQADATGLVASGLMNLGTSAQVLGDYGRAASLYEEGLVLLRELGRQGSLAYLLMNWGWMDLLQGEYSEAARKLEEGLSIARANGQQTIITFTLNNLGVATLALGDRQRAGDLLREAMLLSSELEDRYGIADRLDAMAWLAAAEGQSQRAAQLLGAADTMRESIGAHRSPVPPFTEDHLASARALLGEEAFGRAWARGRSMTHDRAIEYALGEDVG